MRHFPERHNIIYMLRICKVYMLECLNVLRHGNFKTCLLETFHNNFLSLIIKIGVN